MKESEVNKLIKRNLRLFCPQVIALIRIFTGNVETVHGGWVRGADPGTADWVAVVNDRGTGHAVFIEVKRSKGGVHKDEQKIFQHKFDGVANIHYVLVRSVSDVVYYVNKNILDKSLVDVLS